MKSLFSNIFFKMGVILVLILLLLIPTSMVKDLIHERMNRQTEASLEVRSKHAMAQNLSGPVLTIPFVTAKNVRDTKGNMVKRTEKQFLHILPERLDIECQLNPETRKRGIYEIVVYNSDLKYSGLFDKINLDKHGIHPDQLRLNEAFITTGISDMKGLSQQVSLKVNDSVYNFDPGVTNEDIIHSGLNVPIQLDSLQEQLQFSYNLGLKGSEGLMFAPIGKETTLKMSSDWKDPSFNGNFLPDERKVSEDGFKAIWKVFHLNRNYPQNWVGRKHSISNSMFGVDLKLPVDVYQKSERVAKYAMLFIVLTFLVFFFVEILNKVLIHPIQYILVGVALVLFYVLLIAFSEQLFFNLAYLVAAAMTILLVTFYCRSVLRTWGLALMTGSILTILYGFIFILIQLQDYALLFGSLGVFLILAVTMYFSRKIDWFAIIGTNDQSANDVEKVES